MQLDIQLAWGYEATSTRERRFFGGLYDQVEDPIMGRSIQVDMTDFVRKFGRSCADVYYLSSDIVQRKKSVSTTLKSLLSRWESYAERSHFPGPA